MIWNSQYEIPISFPLPGDLSPGLYQVKLAATFLSLVLTFKPVSILFLIYIGFDGGAYIIFVMKRRYTYKMD